MSSRCLSAGSDRIWLFAVLVLAFYLSRLAELSTLNLLISTLLPYTVFAVIVVFAPEIRLALTRLGRKLALVDSAETTAIAVTNLLAENGLARTGASPPSHIFLATDAPDRFARVGEIFLGRKPTPVELVDLQGS